MKAKKLILSLIGGAILMVAYLAYFHAKESIVSVQFYCIHLFVSDCVRDGIC